MCSKSPTAVNPNSTKVQIWLPAPPGLGSQSNLENTDRAGRLHWLVPWHQRSAKSSLGRCHRPAHRRLLQAACIRSGGTRVFALFSTFCVLALRSRRSTVSNAERPFSVRQRDQRRRHPQPSGRCPAQKGLLIQLHPPAKSTPNHAPTAWQSTSDALVTRPRKMTCAHPSTRAALTRSSAPAIEYTVPASSCGTTRRAR
jgi:hypothetical protein